ncbi:MAG TPA: hypothetical protein PKV16_05565 [Caldisericia bacterium]|nr:hypothetical protein [Caldisericia bacterium]HPF48780.1 hypothetical protein [Caldisericia bacterium]HPI83560.1 hypothetical protein [Caldisericia bacterium]HPQ93235.1 hypothetical protein [Caldisericia bacterium]HRV74932.1 hypothetical protein [Caldisericia bacterium]
MNGNDDRLLQILEDLADGKISKQEARQLIKTVMKSIPKRIRIHVLGRDGRKKVNIKVPIPMISKALCWIENDVKVAKIKKQIEDALLDEDFRGEVAEVESESGEDRVVVIIE